MPDPTAHFFSADGGGTGASGVQPKPAGSALEVLARVLEESAAALSSGEGLQIPDDDLHREILVPLLPAMLNDKAIRQHWRTQTASGFVARLAAHLESNGPAPHWVAADFEIHVTASYLAGPDAKALADTLLSEELLRDLTAALMNQVLEVVWAKLPVAVVPVAEPVTPPAEAEPAVVEPAAVEAPSLVPEPAVSEEPAPVPAAEEGLVEAVATVADATPPAEREGYDPGYGHVVLRALKLNPIRGVRHTFGGLGERGWMERNPLKRRRIM